MMTANDRQKYWLCKCVGYSKRGKKSKNRLIKSGLRRKERNKRGKRKKRCNEKEKRKEQKRKKTEKNNEKWKRDMEKK